MKNNYVSPAHLSRYHRHPKRAFVVTISEQTGVFGKECDWGQVLCNEILDLQATSYNHSGNVS